ncbi:MAG: methyltransferase domain-containing protein [Planctomycetales bacterium]|nr:methyltransferase domain-containing protein [Planctomycetales bacterium]
MLGLQRRRQTPELMDQPGLGRTAHRQALGGLARTNGWGSTQRCIWNALERIAQKRRLQHMTLLDVASGAGDTAIWLSQTAERAGLDLSIDGCDISPQAVEFATDRARTADCSRVRFFCHDFFSYEPLNSYDFVISSLFLHHQTEHQAQELLAKMAAAAEHAVLIDDLERSMAGYLLAWCGTRILTRSPIVHVDGPLSVQAAFTDEEARALAESAGLHGIEIVRHWPKRYLLVWEKQCASTRLSA